MLSIIIGACSICISFGGQDAAQDEAIRAEHLASLLLSTVPLFGNAFPAPLVDRRWDSAVMGVKRNRNKKKRSSEDAKPLGFSKEVSVDSSRPVGFSKEILADSSKEIAKSVKVSDQRGETTDLGDLQELQDKNTRTVARPSEEVSRLDISGTRARNTADEFGPATYEIDSVIDTFSNLRVGSLEAPPSFEEVLAPLLAIDAENKEEMWNFVQTNRDLVDNRFLHRLTAEKLLAQNTNRIERGDKLTGVLKRVVKACLDFDKPFYREVGNAEKRIVPLLSKAQKGDMPSAEEVKKAAGEGPQIMAFWIVLKSSISSWQAKLNHRKFGKLAPKQLKLLYAIDEALESDYDLLDRGGIAPLHKLFALPNPSHQFEDKSLGNLASETDDDNVRIRRVFEEFTTDSAQKLLLIRRLGCISTQAERHSTDNYGSFTRWSAALYDIVFRGSVQLIELVDIKSPPRETSESFIANSESPEPDVVAEVIESVWGD